MDPTVMTLDELTLKLQDLDTQIAAMGRAGQTHTETCDRLAARRFLAQLVADRAAERTANPLDTDPMRDRAIRFLDSIGYSRRSDPFGLIDPEPQYAPNSLSEGGWPTDEDGYER